MATSNSNAEPGTSAEAPASMSEDWYHGHKVVAYPGSAFGGMSIREVVSERNEIAQNDNHQQRPRRSNSLGRQPTRPGRDIIQDVYDRMGVNYARGNHPYENDTYVAPPQPPPNTNNNIGYEEAGPPITNIVQGPQPSFSDSISDFTNNNSSSVMMMANNHNSNNAATFNSPTTNNGAGRPKFSGRYRMAAAASTTKTPDRGRTRPDNSRGRMTEPRSQTGDPREAPESEGRRRARSLSRGLSVRGIWPPPKDSQPTVDNTNSETPAIIRQSNTNQTGIPVGQLVSPLRIQHHSAKPPAAVVPVAPSISPSSPDRQNPPIKRSHSFDARPQYGIGLRSTAGLGPPAASLSGAGTTMHQNHYHQNKLRSPQTGMAPHTGMEVSVPSSSVRDEKKEGDETSVASITDSTGGGGGGLDDLPTHSSSIPSIKDRISVFAGAAKVSPGPAPAQRNPRRNTFAGSGGGGGGGPPGGATNYAVGVKATAPPKVDIYESSQSQHDHTDDPYSYENHEGSVIDADMEDPQQQGAPEPSTVPPSAAATAAAEVAAKYMRPSELVQSKKAASSSRHSTGGGGTRSSIVNSYLNVIQSSTAASIINSASNSVTNSVANSRSCFQQQTQQSAFDGNGSNSSYGMDEMNGGGVTSVVGHTLSEEPSEGVKSSHSYSEASNGDNNRSVSGRKQPVWRTGTSRSAAGSFVPNVASSQGGGSSAPSTISINKSYASNANHGSNSPDNTFGGPSAEMIERMVDERVHIQLREVETRMEGLLRKWMDSMNNKITTRLDAMETSIKDSMPEAYPRHEI